MNSDIMNSEMMIKLALKLGELTGAGTITWSKSLAPGTDTLSKNRDLIGDEFWSSEHEGKCFRIYEYGLKTLWAPFSKKWLDADVRLELWDAEREHCEATFPDNGAFSNLLNFIRHQESFSVSAKQAEDYVLKLVNAAS